MTSRTSLQHDHLLQAPDSFVRAPLPGMERGTAIVHGGRALGAKFTQYTAELEASGRLGSTPGERFLYLLAGRIRLDGSEIEPGGFAFVLQGEPHCVDAVEPSRLVVIEKLYDFLGGDLPPRFAGSVRNIKGQPLMGDEGVTVQALIPDQPQYDMAVNVMTFEPGAALSMVESHVMEHGLLMLAGGGVYRLGERWYTVQAGDFIWMAPYCPQWFAAVGKTAAQYLIFKDWNRHPL